MFDECSWYKYHNTLKVVPLRGNNQHRGERILRFNKEHKATKACKEKLHEL